MRAASNSGESAALRALEQGRVLSAGNDRHRADIRKAEHAHMLRRVSGRNDIGTRVDAGTLMSRAPLITPGSPQRSMDGAAAPCFIRLVYNAEAEWSGTTHDCVP